MADPLASQQINGIEKASLPFERSESMTVASTVPDMMGR